MSSGVALKDGRRIYVPAVESFFKRVRFNDWFSRADVAWYLRKALYVASAWEGRTCVGIAVLTGDGRIGVSVDLLAVEASRRGEGIGSRLMERVVARIERLRPHHVGVEVFTRRAERFYARFGFRRNKGTWLLEHGPTAGRLRRIAKAARGKRS